MKVIFLCGSLEPGRDGVGDHTLLLSGELVRQGHQAAIIALNDPFLQEQYYGYKETGGIRLLVLRLPDSFPESRRFRCAKSWIDTYAPDWISLQFVPFSFSPNGLPISFVIRLKGLLKYRQVHLMMHESWVSKGDGVKWKMLLLAFVQKIVIKRMIVLIDPIVIHTTTPFSFVRLQKLGFPSKTLPLFSNIMPNSSSLLASESKTIRIAIFGQAENRKAITAFLLNFNKGAVDRSSKIEVVLIGSKKETLELLKNNIEQLEGFKNNVRLLGLMEAIELSKVLRTCALGLTPVPRHLLGKSGSVAAFIAHGLPVAAPYVCPGRDPDDIGFFSSNLCATVIKKPTFASLQMAGEASVRAKDEIDVKTVAKKFIADLQLAVN